jgi:hypothetical protein
MRTIPYATDEDETVRTQITLTTSLKKAIEEKATKSGQSLSEYLRRAASLSILLDEQERENLTELAQIAIGSVDLKNHPQWSNKTKVTRWVKTMRSEWQ